MERIFALIALIAAAILNRTLRDRRWAEERSDADSNDDDSLQMLLQSPICPMRKAGVHHVSISHPCGEILLLQFLSLLPQHLFQSSSLSLSDRDLKENPAVLAYLSPTYTGGFMLYGASDSVVSARGKKASCKEQGSTLFFPSNLPQR